MTSKLKLLFVSSGLIFVTLFVQGVLPGTIAADSSGTLKFVPPKVDKQKSSSDLELKLPGNNPNSQADVLNKKLAVPADLKQDGSVTSGGIPAAVETTAKSNVPGVPSKRADSSKTGTLPLPGPLVSPKAQQVPVTGTAPILPKLQSDNSIDKKASAKKPTVGKATDVQTDTAKSEYDPIKENGNYFVDWPKPKVAIVLTGLLDGYIEPCGCAGMDRMKGGLSRRATFLNDLAGKGWNLISFDTGKIADGFGIQEELKFDMAVNALRLMKYQAVGIGPNELKFPAYFLLTFTAPSGNNEPSLFVSANMAVYAFNNLYTLPYKIIETSGIRIGFTSVLFETEELKHRDESILIEDPSSKLREIMPEFLKEKCDLRILAVHGTEFQAKDLAKRFPEFDVILTSDSPTIPPVEPKIINERQRLIELGEKGKYSVVLGLYDDPKNPIRYQRVALDSRYKSSEDVRLLMKGYQDILKTLITTKGYKGGLGLSLVESPKYASLGKYVGSKKCESCHEESYRIWRRSGHSTAWNSLTKTASPPRDFDPECVSCHVVGWQSLENFPYSTGFDQEKTTPHLTNVGCESCHGPGEKHLAAELGDNEQLQKTIRQEMRLGKDTRKVCFSCHDGDNSPEFDFDSYYKKIEHKEKEPE